MVEGVAVARDGRRVLEGVGFRLEAGDALELTGPNGTGKSTLLCALGGLLPLAAGTIRLRVDAMEVDTTVAECVHLIGHADGLKTGLTARENLAFAAAIAGDGPPRRGEGGRRPDEGAGPQRPLVPQAAPILLAGPGEGDASAMSPAPFAAKPLTPIAALERLGLGAIADLPVAYLSAGQRRRVALGRLLTAWRPLWLLDEPLNALDMAAQQTLRTLIADHRAAGGLVVAATHAPLDMPGARAMRLAA